MSLGAVVDATEVPMAIATGIGLTGPLGYRPSAPVVNALKDRRLCRPSRLGGGSPAGRPSSTLGSAARPRCYGGSLVGRLKAWPQVTDLLRRAGEAAPWADRSVFSGLRSLGFPGGPMGDIWRAADLVREHRGDSHVISWAVGGADAVEVLLLTEQWWGLPAWAYTPSRGWSDADMDAGFDRLQRWG